MWIAVIIGMVVFLFVLVFFIVWFYITTNGLPDYGIFIFFIFFAFFQIWLIFGEFRTKIIKVKIEGDRISWSGYCGLGKTRERLFKEFNGFRTSILPSKYNEYEYLYLMEGERKLIKISEFYHKNYAELKQYISKKSVFLGEEQFSLIREFKEIFI